MLHHLSQSIADFLLSQNCFDDEDLDIYIYGTELVLSYPPNNPAPCRIEETMVK